MADRVVNDLNWRSSTGGGDEKTESCDRKSSFFPGTTWELTFFWAFQFFQNHSRPSESRDIGVCARDANCCNYFNLYVAHGKRHCCIFVPFNSELHVEEHYCYSFLTPGARKIKKMQRKTFVRLNRHFFPLFGEAFAWRPSSQSSSAVKYEKLKRVSSDVPQRIFANRRSTGGWAVFRLSKKISLTLRVSESSALVKETKVILKRENETNDLRLTWMADMFRDVIDVLKYIWIKWIPYHAGDICFYHDFPACFFFFVNWCWTTTPPIAQQYTVAIPIRSIWMLSQDRDDIVKR